MSAAENRNVSLEIGGRRHVISVAGDEEDHLKMLAQMIDARVRKLDMGQGQTEARQLLVVALMLADELHSLKTAPASADAAQRQPPAPRPQKRPAPPEIAPDVLTKVAALADRVEKLAARLEQSDEAP